MDLNTLVLNEIRLIFCETTKVEGKCLDGTAEDQNAQGVSDPEQHNLTSNLLSVGTVIP